MGIIHVGENRYNTKLIVFDKDGLLFKSKPFWIELAYARMLELKNYIDNDLILKWLQFIGVKAFIDCNNIVISDIDEVGIIAVASPSEEITITAGFLTEHKNITWTNARNISKEIFKLSDENMQLKNSLVPQQGFPNIFKRLRKGKILYGIATSDDYKRAIDSINFYDDANELLFVVTPKEVKNGKPNTDMLYYIEEKTGIKISEMIMIGDSYVDVKMAYDAGAVSFGIPEVDSMIERMKPYATEIIKSLDDIIIEEE